MREDGTMFLFGGYNGMGDLSNDIHSYSIKDNVWKKQIDVSDLSPCPRVGHSCVLLKNKIFLFGGKGNDSKKFNDLWKFDLRLNTWE